MILISAGSIELIFGGTSASYELPCSLKLTVELLFSITKRLSRRDPPGFPADHVKLFIRLRCVAIPMYLRLTVSYSYLEITVLVTFSFIWAVSRSAMRFRYDPENVQMGFLGHYLSTRFSV